MSWTGRTHWRPGARVARLKSSHGYGWVLLLVVISFVFAASAPDDSWARAIITLLACATLALTLWTSGFSRDYKILSALAGLGVVVAVVSLGTSEKHLVGVIWIANVALTVAIVLVLGVGIFDQQEVNRQAITGAVCAYVLIGMLFTFVYGAAAALGSGPFFAQGTDGTTSLRLYFSFVTLATLGYGDYTPSGNFGHIAAVFEALLGQLYLVTVVALLVGNFSRRPRSKSSGSHDDTGTAG